MQSIINANQKSKTEEFMVSTGEKIPFYQETPTFPELGIQFQKVLPYIDVSGAPANKSIIFKLPPGAGFLYEASVGFECTAPVSTESLGTTTAFDIIRDLQWEVNGQPIVHKTKNSMVLAMKSWKGESYRTHSLRYAAMLVPATEKGAANADASFLCYLPLFDSFLTRTEKALLLNEVKDINLRITFDTALASGLGADAITSVSSTLYCQSYLPKLSVYNELVKKDWSQPMTMQMLNNYEEVGALSGTTNTGTTYTINCPFLVSKTHIACRANGAVLGLGLPFKPIQTISMNLGGVQFLSSMKPSRMNSLAAKYGTSSISAAPDTAITYDDDGIISIDWGILAGRDMNSGTAFFDELRGSNITLTWASTDMNAVTHSLYVCHEYWNGVQFTPSQGGGNLAVVVNN